MVHPDSKMSELEEAILDAVDSEYERTANHWLACFGSRVFQAECAGADMQWIKVLMAEIKKRHGGDPPWPVQKALVRHLARTLNGK